MRLRRVHLEVAIQARILEILDHFNLRMHGHTVMRAGQKRDRDAGLCRSGTNETRASASLGSRSELDVESTTHVVGAAVVQPIPLLVVDVRIFAVARRRNFGECDDDLLLFLQHLE